MSLGVSQGPRSWERQTLLLEFPFGLNQMGLLSFFSYLWGNFCLLPRVLELAWSSSGNRFWWGERGLEITGWAEGKGR